MNELVREIEEDIRQERIDKLWHSFGKIIVASSLAIILVTIGVVVYQNHTRSIAMDNTAQMLKGMDRINIEDFKGAVALFDQMSQDPKSGYYGLAMLRKAQSYAALGQVADAQKTYETLAKTDPFTGPLAKMLSYGNDAGSEVLPAPDKSAPLYYMQCEFRAWQLFQQGKKEQAIDQFAAIVADDQAPATIRERVSEVLQHIAPEKLAEKPTETPAKPLGEKDVPKE